MNKVLVDSIMETFQGEFECNLETIEHSGALSGDEPEGMVMKVVLYLTAQQFHPLSSDGKKLLNNLQHFV